MAGIETVEGACPNCGKQMYQKWESGNYGFMFDACCHCGFITATQDLQDANPITAWASILEARGEGARTIREFSSKVAWLHEETLPEHFDFGGKPIFTFSDDIADHIIDIDMDIIAAADAIEPPAEEPKPTGSFKQPENNGDDNDVPF